MDALELLRSKEGADFTVSVGSETFQLHSFIMKVGCKYFQGRFESGLFDCKSKTAHAFDAAHVDAKVFAALLPYIYAKRLDSIRDMTMDQVVGLFELADYLQLPSFDDWMREHHIETFKERIDAEVVGEEVDGEISDEKARWLLQQLVKVRKAKFPASALAEALSSCLSQYLANTDKCLCTYALKEYFQGSETPVAPPRERSENFEPNVEPARYTVTQADVDFLWWMAGSCAEATTAKDVRQATAVAAQLKSENDALKARLEQMASTPCGISSNPCASGSVLTACDRIASACVSSRISGSCCKLPWWDEQASVEPLTFRWERHALSAAKGAFLFVGRSCRS
eukprot:TRINITY_DN25619_c0_g4_i1.p1 TRINITY_DN25619_c0_g4~~TRINITY_DN25619_c0_g4_i1.p1  ORF type:complete len:341 (+),score=39.30 TRINITY_DN25619_c0_g4_i1:129-1151(+)